MMEKTIKNGVGSKMDASQKTDTLKGATALAVVEVKKETESPLQQRLKKVSEMQKLIEKRKKLVDAGDKLTTFEETLNGDDDCISLESNKKSVEITKPDAVRKVVDLLKSDVQQSLAQVDSELLTATI